MPVKLRLQRHGRTHRPFYHIVVADSRSPRDGKFIERLGSYDPVLADAKVVLDHESTLKWLKNGAQPTETVRAILSHEGLMLKLHLHRKGKTTEDIEAAYQLWLQDKTSRLAKSTSKRAGAKAADAALRLEAEKKKAQERADKQAEKLKSTQALAAAATASEVAEEAPEAPVMETAVLEAPVEAAVAETVAVVEEVVVETPVAEAPIVETPVAEAPEVEAPAVEAPATEESKA
jgi:small subunit ribosomal protein S16